MFAQAAESVLMDSPITTGAIFVTLTAAIAYMRAGGERAYMAPLLKHFRETRLPDITQAAIDKAM